MKRVNIRIIRTRNFTAKLIHLGMFLWAILRWKKINRTYNHFEIGYDGLTSGAIKDGVKTRNWLRYVKEHKWIEWVEYTLELTDEEWNEGYKYLTDVEDIKYEVENFWWHLVKIIIGKWKGGRSSKELYCYEHGIRFLNVTKRFELDNFLNPHQFKILADKYILSVKHKYVKGKFIC